MDRLAHLNPRQREAVTTLSGPLLVLAGAGTGKTRVITHRIAELVRSGIRPNEILSVTFTNKAAREMLERARALMGGGRREDRPVISTFHSLCVRILREDITALGYPETFVIHDRGDQESVARASLREVRVGDKAMKPADLLGRIGRWKMHGIAPESAGDHVEDDLDFLAAVAYRKYQSRLKAAGAVDFDDLLLLVARLFDRHPDVLQRWQRRFRHVQVDEYQDTNGVQFQLVAQLVRGHQNLCVVGDDDQSIYGWRGADVSHILGFSTHFPKARVVRLEDNYRCTDHILDLANRLVRHNRGRHQKVLRAHKTGDDVRIVEFPDEQAEAEGIVREIAYLVGDERIPPTDIAILFRTNEQTRAFETELRRLKVPYLLVGGQSFFDRREIKDLLAYLKVIAQPTDEASLLRIVNTPRRGIGTSTTERIVARAVSGGTSFWEAIPVVRSDGGVPPRAAAGLTALNELLTKYRARFEEHPRRLGPILSELIDEIGYEAEIERLNPAADQQLARVEVVHQFVEAVDEYANREAKPSLIGFVQDSTLFDRESEDDEQTRDAVRLMTLHSAKGLEFPRVYMVGLEEGFLPHRRSLAEGDETAIAEERRLCYVGITRAREHLCLSRAATRTKWGKRRPSLPSRFLFEMQDDEAVAEMLAESETEADEEASAVSS